MSYFCQKGLDRFFEKAVQMARIPQHALEKLKRDVDLVGLITASGVKLEKKGGNLVGLCPMHDDKEPSLVVTPSKNLWNCLGACGTVIDWVMQSQGVSFRRANSQGNLE